MSNKEQTIQADTNIAVCHYCCFYLVSTDSNLGGACRRYPPTVHSIYESSVSEYPSVKWNDWCGEHIIYK